MDRQSRIRGYLQGYAGGKIAQVMIAYGRVQAGKAALKQARLRAENMSKAKQFERANTLDNIIPTSV